MDIERSNSSSEILQEIDVYLKVPSKDLYLVQYPSRTIGAAFTKYESVESIHVQPEQRKLSMAVKIDQKCENYSKKSEEELKYKLESKVINNRTNYCVGRIVDGALILVPVSTCVQMKKSFIDYEEKFKTEEDKNAIKEKKEQSNEMSVQEINSQIKRKDNLKLLERKLRSHPFQQNVFDSETPVPLRLYQQNTPESSRLVDSLLDPPKEFKTLKPLPKGEYLRYLF
jgi:hypothetical protein